MNTNPNQSKQVEQTAALERSSSHQALALGCAPPRVCPRWRWASAALVCPPAPAESPPGFGSPAALWNCPSWWRGRAETTACWQPTASRCAPGLDYCDWKTQTTFITGSDNKAEKISITALQPILQATLLHNKAKSKGRWSLQLILIEK